MFTKELGVFPVVPAIRFASIIAIDAAMQTSIVVLMPAGRPCSVRLKPMMAPAMAASASRNAMSCHTE